jgi:hypothetical protein
MTYWGGLEQPAQEPVTLIRNENGNFSPKHQCQECENLKQEASKHHIAGVGKMIDSSQKPYGFVKDGVFYFKKPDDVFIYKALYTHPHQWQGLTDDEIRHCLYDLDTQDFIQFSRAIEQALKEKNHVGAS